MPKDKKRCKKFRNTEWLQKHLGELVDKYAGKYAVIADGEAFVGQDPLLLEKEAKEKHPGTKIIGLPIPRPEDFQCAL